MKRSRKKVLLLKGILSRKEAKEFLAHVDRCRMGAFGRAMRFVDEIVPAEKDIKAGRVRSARAVWEKIFRDGNGLAKRKNLKSSDVEAAIAKVRKRKGVSHVRPE